MADLHRPDSPLAAIHRRITGELAAVETLRYRLAAASLLAGVPRWASSAAVDVADATDGVHATTLARVLAVADTAEALGCDDTLPAVLDATVGDPYHQAVADAAEALQAAVQACKDLAADSGETVADALTGVAGRLELLLGRDGSYGATGQQATAAGRDGTGLRLDAVG